VPVSFKWRGMRFDATLGLDGIVVFQRLHRIFECGDDDIGEPTPAGQGRWDVAAERLTSDEHDASFVEAARQALCSAGASAKRLPTR
jgi:hypothetical protein